MAHKVNPKIFRIKETNDWDSRWFNKKKIPEYLEEDFKIRQFLKKRLKETAVQKIEIERFPGKVKIIINSARPGLIIGRGGEGVEKLRKDLDELLISKSSVIRAKPQKEIQERERVKIDIREIREPWSKAALACEWVAQQIEKRIRYRRVLKQSLEKIMASKEVKGARIELSGRLMGAEMSRRAWLDRGRMPRQTIRADIDYCQCEANCSYGVIGVKVWIYKGDKF
jgi:small subunit ribosomal protein S3